MESGPNETIKGGDTGSCVLPIVGGVIMTGAICGGLVAGGMAIDAYRDAQEAQEALIPPPSKLNLKHPEMLQPEWVARAKQRADEDRGR